MSILSAVFCTTAKWQLLKLSLDACFALFRETTNCNKFYMGKLHSSTTSLHLLGRLVLAITLKVCTGSA